MSANNQKEDLSLLTSAATAHGWRRCFAFTIVVAAFTFEVTVAGNCSAQTARAVDASTMNHKLLMGYQGWFACPGDGSLPNHWVHWFRKNNPVATNATVDLWPDVSELDAEELFPTDMKLPDGSTAKAYSAFTKKTVVRHFRWMQENNLDGVIGFRGRAIRQLHGGGK